MDMILYWYIILYIWLSWCLTCNWFSVLSNFWFCSLFFELMSLYAGLGWILQLIVSICIYRSLEWCCYLCWYKVMFIWRWVHLILFVNLVMFLESFYGDIWLMLSMTGQLLWATYPLVIINCSFKRSTSRIIRCLIFLASETSSVFA